MSGELIGRTIVVTRPRAQALPLAEWIREHGGVAVIFPLLEIRPADDARSLQAALLRLDTYQLAIFISPNAVDFSVPAILSQRSWPEGLRAAAIGPGSDARLREYGISGALTPKMRFDSEALLELTELRAEGLCGKRVLIFRGDGGREFLAETLRERGAEVDYVHCYRRVAPRDATELQALWRDARLDALIVSSSEGLRNLVALLDEVGCAHLQRTPVFVPHPRIAESAQALGLQRVILSAGADAGIVTALQRHRWS